MNKRAVVSFSNQKGRYVQNMARLSDSLRNNFTTGEFIGFINEESLGCPKHSEQPYGFKIFCFENVVQRGFTSVLYLDSSVFAVGNIDNLFDEIEQDGFIAQQAGHLCSTWSNDHTLNHFGITRDEAEKMPMIGNAGFLGLDFTKPIANQFFRMWKEAYLNDCFKGAWNNDTLTESIDERCKGARHDMASSSIIFNKLGMIEKAKPGDEILQYGGIYSANINSTIILKAEG